MIERRRAAAERISTIGGLLGWFSFWARFWWDNLELGVRIPRFAVRVFREPGQLVIGERPGRILELVCWRRRRGHGGSGKFGVSGPKALVFDSRIWYDGIELKTVLDTGSNALMFDLAV